jgi:uncharacterized membrane protein YcfT
MQTSDGRVAWVDYAKGFCICFVVMMHSTLGVGVATGETGWLHPVVAFALPFRMPDFFMISGLFLGLVIDRSWRVYLDRKVVHFVYFCVLWTIIQFAFKAPSMAAHGDYLEVARQFLLSFIEPFGTLWFIYLLPIFFVVIKLTKSVPVWIMWPIAAALEISHYKGDWTVPYEFAARFVYIYTGFVLAPYIFRMAALVQKHVVLALGGLLLWGLVNGMAVYFGYAQMPFISLALGLIGACAVVSVSALLSMSDLARPLRYLGRNSIVVYLSFFLPMAISRTILLKTGAIDDIGTICAIVTVCGIVGSLLMFWAARITPLRFLYERAGLFYIAPRKKGTAPAGSAIPTMQPAE